MKARDERKELEKMLKESPDKINKNVAKNEDVPELQSEPLIDVNFAELKAQCDSEARIMVNNSIAFVIPADMIENNAYLKNKLEIDIISLSGMIYQLRTNELMQKTLMDQVNLGMAHPRMFEVFAGMSKIIGELNKQLLQTVEAIKETYRNFKNDVKEQRNEALGPHMNETSGMITTGDGSVVTRGTKELINHVKRLKNDRNNQTYIDDAQLVPKLNLDIN